MNESDRLQEAQNAGVSQPSGTAPAAGPLAGLPTRPRGDARPEETRLSLGTTMPTMPTLPILESMNLPTPSVPRCDAPRPSRRRRQVVSEQTEQALSKMAAEPYPEDAGIIERFSANAHASGSNKNTILIYSKNLTRFSAWLRKNDMPGINGRLFDEELTNDLREFTRRTEKWRFTTSLLCHLRQSETSGMVKIPNIEQKHLQIPNEDNWLLCEAFPKNDQTSKNYKILLKQFSTWLQEKGEPGLCEKDNLHSDRLTAQARTYIQEVPNRECLISALKHLRRYDCGENPVYATKRDTRAIPADDRLFSEKYEVWLREQGYGGKPCRRDSAASRASSFRSFSAWLQHESPSSASLASRIQSGDRSLEVDLDLYTHSMTAGFARTMKVVLRRARQMVADSHADSANYLCSFTGLGQMGLHLSRPESRGAAEPSASVNRYPATPAGSSYSSMFPPTPRGGWPDAPQGSWSELPEVSSSTFGDLESLDSGHPDGGRESYWDALNQEATGPWHMASSRASVPTFDEGDTGSGWQHGAQPAPPWLVQRGVHDQQIVRIRDLEYRVVANPGTSNAWGESQLFLYPHIRGG
ncbi:hypothetical protein [Xylophilus ampelinus]|uniref:hypothetical protein n=1 Tax=Xylophilus ampelinus TaxID=54067 RepID=UPI001F2791F3|nr:hypothetical protein [Xylophilus ampelinus]MCS4509724.1 hypothetical protein [Xylophilus ampelinus]